MDPWGALLGLHWFNKKDQDNTLGESYFEPLSEKTVYEQGFKTWHDNAKRALGVVQGKP